MHAVSKTFFFRLLTVFKTKNMKKYSLGFLFIVLCNLMTAQQMTNDSLLEIITKNSDSIQGTTGSWQFLYEGQQLFCITDQNNNRMRIMSPIAQSDILDKGLLLDAMTANFHSALDVRYAIANGVLWSAFIHPLQELSPGEVESAISQVQLAAKTFGTTFSSTELIFGAGGSESDKKSLEKEDEEAAPLQKL